MFRRRDPLDSIRIATPCDAAWDDMTGDDRVRHCTACALNVYNVAELTRDEIRSLFARTEGRVCLRLHQRADGTLITRDCPNALEALRRRVSRAGAAAAAALLSFAGLATGCATRPATAKQSDLVSLHARRPAYPGEAVLSGHVHDEKGFAIPGALVELLDAANRQESVIVVGSDGAFAIHSARPGSYRVQVRLPGFLPTMVDHVEVKRDEVIDADLVLRPGRDPGTMTITMGAPIIVERPR